jgi:lipase
MRLALHTASFAARREPRPPHAYADSDADVHNHLEQGADGRWRFRFIAAAAVVAWSEMTRPRASLAGLDVPTLLIKAGREAFVSDALLAGLREDLGPALRVETLDTSHMLYWDAFEDTARLVHDFLR